MYSAISLQVISFLYVFILSIVYFLKRKYNFIESKIYKVLLIITMVILLLDIAGTYLSIHELYTRSIVPVLLELYLIGLFGWLALFVSYALLNRNNDRYESVKELSKGHPLAYIWIFTVVISFVALIILQVLSRKYGINDYGTDVDLIYLLGLACSIIVLIVLLVNSKKVARYKNWSMLVSTLILASSIFIQLKYEDMSIIGSGITLITLFQYFTMENPDLKYIDELNALKVKAEEANQAKTNFLASMSHEIRTPMNAIIGLSETILNNEKTPADLKTDIKNINDAGNILLEIVNNILDITKVEAGKLVLNNAPYSLADLIAKLSHITKINLTEKPIKFETEVIGYIPNTLMGDEVKVYQILMNILSNAVKYTKKGSIKFQIDSVISGNKDILTFKVIDTGIGIKKADNAKLFEKFERLDQEQSDIQGTGLGLVITKKLLDLMGGKISFESVYQQGTTFTINLEQEIVDKEKVDFKTYKAKKVSVDEYFDGSKYKILLVDDNLLNLKVAEKLLRNYKFNITSLHSGLECLNYTRNNKYDLIFLDHMMPEMDGIHTLYNMKQRASGFDTPVVVLTANAIEGSKDMYLKEGFVDYLSKPIDQVELDRILREQLHIDDDGNGEAKDMTMPIVKKVKEEPVVPKVEEQKIVQSAPPKSNVAPIFPVENTPKEEVKPAPNVAPIFPMGNEQPQPPKFVTGEENKPKEEKPKVEPIFDLGDNK